MERQTEEGDSVLSENLLAQQKLEDLLLKEHGEAMGRVLDALSLWMLWSQDTEFKQNVEKNLQDFCMSLKVVMSSALEKTEERP